MVFIVKILFIYFLFLCLWRYCFRRAYSQNKLRNLNDQVTRTTGYANRVFRLRISAPRVFNTTKAAVFV